MKEPDRKPRRKSKLDPRTARGQTPELEGSPGSTVLSAPGRRDRSTARQARELEFLHEFRQSFSRRHATGRADADDVDRTTTALDVEVCSVYLMEREIVPSAGCHHGLDRARSDA